MKPLRLIMALMGFLAAALGVARDNRPLIWVAIGLLGSSLAIRIVQRLLRR